MPRHPLTLAKLGKLGMRIIDATRAEEQGHAVVDSVSEGPAMNAGVQPGDVIVAVNGMQVGVGGRAGATALITMCLPTMRASDFVKLTTAAFDAP